MRIDAAKYEGGQLVLSIPREAVREAARFAHRFKPGEYRLAPERNKRSEEANRYCWALCGEIADALGVRKEDVYRANIRDGGTYFPFSIRAEAVEKFQWVWSGQGIGWFSEVVDDSEAEGHKLVFAYYGSSKYDVKQMSALMDRIIQDAKSIGIETISDRERSLLLDGWGKQYEKKNKGAVDSKAGQRCRSGA